MCIPLAIPGDIRYRLDLAGGATMDIGCYAIHMLRFLAGAEPEVVTAAPRSSRRRDVDRWMQAELRFADGATGRITCSLFSATLLRIGARVVGERGELRATNPVAPHLFHRLTLRSGAPAAARDGARRGDLHPSAARLRRRRARRRPGPDRGADAIANMRVIDAVYDGAASKTGDRMRSRVRDARWVAHGIHEDGVP